MDTTTTDASTALELKAVPPIQKIDPDGFDDQTDTVGAGIYSGNVMRNEDGTIVYGSQYQNHNQVPGPRYDGTGYTKISQAIHSGNSLLVKSLLNQHPELVNEISTGGATPLHTSGMSKKGEKITQLLIKAGGDINAVDTYGFKPIHRMASNNLSLGAAALLLAGVDPLSLTGLPYPDSSPLKIAKESGAQEVERVLEFYVAGLGRTTKS